MESVIIANTAEAFGELLEKVARTEEGIRRIRHELTLSQRAFFWGGSDKCVVTPYPIPEALLHHNMRACGYQDVINLSPREPTIALSRAIANDKALWQEIIALVRRDPPAVLSPYAFTGDFSLLLRKLQRKGVSIRTEGVPAKHSLWAARYLDSKLGFRMEMQKLMANHEFLRIPEGFVARTWAEAMGIVEWLYAAGRSAVVKANFGESGWGLWICRVEQYQTDTALLNALKKALGSNPVWRDALLIVEELISVDWTVGGGSPSVELSISDDGSVITYHCGQVVNSAGEFFGVEIGKGAVPPSIRTSMEQVGRVVGERYHALGYRGYCDIDFVVDRNGDIYAVEANTRRTGGTHVHDLARHLFGEAWEDRAYLLSHDSFRYGDHPLTAEAVLEQIQVLLYPVNGGSSGIVITSLNAWDPVMSYVAIGRSAEEGRELQQMLRDRFGR